MSACAPFKIDLPKSDKKRALAQTDFFLSFISNGEVCPQVGLDPLGDISANPFFDAPSPVSTQDNGRCRSMRWVAGARGVSASVTGAKPLPRWRCADLDLRHTNCDVASRCCDAT